MRGRGGMRGMIDAPDERPQVTPQLLRRVGRYALPYRWPIVGMLLLILAHTGLSLLTPLIMRDLIDNTIPAGDVDLPSGIGWGLLSSTQHSWPESAQKPLTCHC